MKRQQELTVISKCYDPLLWGGRQLWGGLPTVPSTPQERSERGTKVP
jgi:hypothetical protein